MEIETQSCQVEEEYRYSVEVPKYIFIDINNLENLNYDQIERLNQEADNTVCCLISKTDNNLPDVIYSDLPEQEINYVMKLQKEFMSDFYGLVVVKPSDYHYIGFYNAIIDMLKKLDFSPGLINHNIYHMEYIHLKNSDLIQVIGLETIY